MNDQESQGTTNQPDKGLGEMRCSTFRFEVGKQYETQNGKLVTVIGRTTLVGYECVECSDGIYRYDRSTHAEDAGRVTGTDHDYSCPDNFKR